jgi:hypothetical protein
MRASALHCIVVSLDLCIGRIHLVYYLICILRAAAVLAFGVIIRVRVLFASLFNGLSYCRARPSLPDLLFLPHDELLGVEEP